MECQLTAIIQGYWEVEPLLNGIQLRSFDHQVVSFMVPIFKDFLCSFDCRTALIQSRRPWGYERYYSQSQTLGSTGFKRGIAKLLSLYETIRNNLKHRELSIYCFSRAHRWTGSVQALYVQAFCEYGCCLPVRGEHGVAWISNLALNGRSQ
jgi:hypothetical protein